MTSSIRRLQPALLALCGFGLLGICSASRQLHAVPSPSGDESQESILLQFADQLSNFQSVRQANRFNGWGHDASSACSTLTIPIDDPRKCDPENTVYISADRNPWTGVSCDAQGRVVCLNLPNLGLQGNPTALSSLSSLRRLQYLSLGGNQFKGDLPEAAGLWLSQVQILHLEHNKINGTLKAEWGSGGHFEELEVLLLQNNELSGSLPSEWSEDSSWMGLQTLNLSNNHLWGFVPADYGNFSAWPSLQLAYLQPGNAFCDEVPAGFPAMRATGDYLSGPTFESIVNFNISCSDAEKTATQQWSEDSSGDNLSSAAVAGIITGEVVLGTFLLLCSGIVHRRYRWRQERSWVLFDWHVVNDAPPKPYFKFGMRLGWGSKTNSSETGSHLESNGLHQNGVVLPQQPAPMNGSQMPFRFSGHAIEAPPHDLAAQDGHAPFPRLPSTECPIYTVNSDGLRSMTDVLWRDSLLSSEDVTIQCKPDGTPHQLGNGSFGKVFKGLLQDVHEVAIKVFEGYVGQREQELLLKEISILRSCRNKNIVQFFGVTIREQDIWMVMELMEGNLFRHLARGHHCTWYFRGRSIALDIARGMHFLHTRRIVHMDLKSPNILLGASGIAKIADVGLARVMGSESIANQVCAGTMHWMAPEVLINGRCTEKADIFSFGVILWEICTAEAPSRGRMSPVSVPDECPEEVAALIEACMGEDPEARPSALDIIQKIQQIPIKSRPVPQPPWYAR